jgi:hypothetical protein
MREEALKPRLLGRIIEGSEKENFLRLALLPDWNLSGPEQVMDFTHYDIKTQEPSSSWMMER